MRKFRDCAIIIQARMSSSRFPGKMMALLGGVPLVEYIYRRCRQSRIPDVLIATSVHESDDVLYHFCRANNIPIYRGWLEDVLQRTIDAAATTGSRYVARVCGDTPLVDINLLEQLLSILITAKCDYVSCDRKVCLPYFYSEAVTLEALKKSRSLTHEQGCLEHVTKFIIEHPEIFAVKFVDRQPVSDAAGGARLTIDDPQDIVLVNRVVALLADRQVFTCEEVIRAVSGIIT